MEKQLGRPKKYKNGKLFSIYLEEDEFNLFRARYGRLAGPLLNEIIKQINHDENFELRRIKIL